MTSARSVVLPLLVSVAALIAMALGAYAAPAGVSPATAQGPLLPASPATAGNTSSSANKASGTQQRGSPALLAGASGMNAMRGAGAP